MLNFRLLVVFLALCLIAGCGSQPVSPLPVLPFPLLPYPTRTVVHNPTSTLPATVTPPPSPTPNLHVIVAGDTLSTIAQRFGVSLETLLAANPGIEPTQLSVGQVLTIPSASWSGIPEDLSTPVPADLGPVSCYSTAGGLTCFAPVHNPNTGALENVKVQITLFGADGQPVESQDAILPLNILQPGETLPASVYFPGSSPARSALSQLKMSSLISTGDQRYVSARIEDLFVGIDWDGRSAQVRGQVSLAEGNPPAGLVWLVAVAYDSGGQIVGFRRWDWKGSIAPDASLPFAMVVYSHGPAIDHLEMLIEARP